MKTNSNRQPSKRGILNIPVTEVKYGNTAVSDHVLRLGYNGIVGPTWKRFGIGGIVKGGKGTKLFGGPMVKGPWAFAFGLGVCIAANREMGTGAEMERLEAAGKEHVVEDGDLIRFDKVLYSVRVVRREFIELVDAR